QGTAGAPVMAGTAALVQATYGGRPFPDTRVTLNYANTRLTSHADFFHGPTLLAVADAQLPVNLAFSGVTGPRLERAAPLALTLVADSLPLEALPSFTSEVSDVRGRVRGNLAIRGTMDHPSTTGTLQLDLGSMRVNSAGVLFTDIVGQLRLAGDSAYVDSLVAHSGGPVRVNGAIGLAQLSRPSFNLIVAANDATVLDNQWGRIRADANLRVRGPYAGLNITGSTNVLGGVIYAPEMQSQHATNLEDPTLGGALAQDTVGSHGLLLPPPNPLLQNLNLNVAVTIQPDTWVRNSQANVEIYTDPAVGPLRVHMNNARQQMTALGTIATDRGEYTYSGRVFQLSNGSATFLGGSALDPLLQLSANYQVQRQGLEALLIQIQVDGTLSKPRVTLASNAQPPLSQSDLLSYLAFGRPASSLLTMSAGTSAGVGGGGLTGIPALAEQQLASLAIGAMVDQTVSDIQEQGTRAGLDVFRIHPGELPPEAAFQGVFQNFFTGTEFEAGKYLSPSLFAEVRGRASTLPGLALQYRTPWGFNWTTTWEPRYLPVVPSFSTVQTASQVRAFGTFLLWSRRF
ncbi:MAG TPA: translocation/assembly module TamB domain-containing protein, partial [Longimicrobiales bacterium]